MAWYDPTSWDWSGAASAVLSPSATALGLGGDPNARLEAGRKNIPEPRGISSDEQSYMNRLRALSGETPGAGYEQTPYYKNLQNDITQQMRREGWAAGNADASRGVMSPGSYGTGMRGATEQTEMEGRLRQAAASQAYEGQIRAQAQQYDQVFRALGIENGIYNSGWEQKFRVAAQNLGITEAEIQVEVERIRTILGVIGGGAGLAATTATGNPGPAMAMRPASVSAPSPSPSGGGFSWGP